MTERLYYYDAYLQSFQARVVETADEGRRVYLDRTAFYPTSGGQPFDLGTLGGVAIVEVIDEEDRIAHVLAAPLAVVDVSCDIDWARRYDHMQQHTGQHLLSAVLEELFGFKTVSFHLGAEACTIDIDGAPTPAQLAQAETRCTAIIAEARPVAVTFEDSAAGLRKASQREGTLRIVSIDGVDRSACGGTHVRTTAEIGLVLTGKLDKVRNTTRVEFVCGARALQRAQSDRRMLSEIARALGSPIENTPALVASLTERAKASEKERQKLATEVARFEGKALYDATPASPDGLRRVIQHGPIDDAMRARAQAFVANERAAFLAISSDPPSILLAASADSGIHAGSTVKSAIAAHNGRGGGSAALAQASVPDRASLDAVVAALPFATL